MNAGHNQLLNPARAYVPRGNKLPGRCVLNGLETELVPDELSNLDALSKQLIQEAKAYQTVVRLGTCTKKVPAYNKSLQRDNVLPSLNPEEDHGYYKEN